MLNKKLMVILDDDARRIEIMRHEISQKIPGLECIIFENAPDLLVWLKEFLSTVTIMSLDHDLGPNYERNGKIFDPGTGRDVVKYLESQNPVCPIVVHTTNRFGGDSMQYALEDAGWVVKRIIPFDDLPWIKNEWIEIVVKLTIERI